MGPTQHHVFPRLHGVGSKRWANNLIWSVNSTHAVEGHSAHPQLPLLPIEVALSSLWSLRSTDLSSTIGNANIFSA